MDERAVQSAVAAALRTALLRKPPLPAGLAPHSSAAAGGAPSARRLMHDARADAESLVARELVHCGVASAVTPAGVAAAVQRGASTLVTSCVALLLLLRSLADAPGSLPPAAMQRALAEAAEALRPRSSANTPLFDSLLLTVQELKAQLAAVY